MHETSWEKMEKFIEVYLGDFRSTSLDILDVGSQLVVSTQATYRSLFDAPQWRYQGLDVCPGINVDIPVADAYRWDEVPADSFDVVISGQALEHIAMFWLTAFEIGRALRPGGLTMLIAPSGGWEHRYPVDCWRFYRDGMTAIADYLGFEVLESYTEWGRPDWADSILVMRKPVWSTEQREKFLRRRELQYAAAMGTEPLGTAPLAPAPVSALAGCDGNRLEPLLESIRTEALAAAAPAAPSSAVRRALRRLVGARGLQLYRRIRYGPHAE